MGLSLPSLVPLAAAPGWSRPTPENLQSLGNQVSFVHYTSYTLSLSCGLSHSWQPQGGSKGYHSTLDFFNSLGISMAGWINLFLIDHHRPTWLSWRECHLPCGLLQYSDICQHAAPRPRVSVHLSDQGRWHGAPGNHSKNNRFLFVFFCFFWEHSLQ